VLARGPSGKVNALSHWKPITGSLVAYIALTIAYTWPLPRHVLHGIAHDPYDPILNTWILWWTTQAAPLTAHWWNAPIFFPAPGTFAFSEHLLGLAPIAAPIIFVTHNATLGYNVMLLATYVLSGLGMYFLAHTLTRRHDAAFVAGVAFAFAPYRLAQLPHIQVLCSFWTPVCLAALHRYDRSGRQRWAALAAGAWLMQALSNGYYLLFVSVLLVIWFAWFAFGRWPARKLGVLAAFWIVPFAIVVPILLGYRRILVGIYGFSRGLEEIQHFSADVGSLLTAPSDVWLWGWLHTVQRPEGELFPGLTIVALVLFGLLAARPFATSAEPTRTRWWLRRVFGAAFLLFAAASLLPIYYDSWRLTIGGVRLLSVARADKPVTLAFFSGLAWLALMPRVVAATRERRPLVFYSLAAFMTWVFALGPDPLFFSHRALYQAPYGWLMRLPAFDGLRVPTRFWMMTLVCLAVIAALALNRLQGRSRRIVAIVAVAGLLLDGWPRTIPVFAEPEHRPAPPGVSARLDLPTNDDADAAVLYQQTFERIPLYNGFSGYPAPHMYAMRTLIAAHDPRILQAMTARGSLGIVIDRAGDPEEELKKFVEGVRGSALVETHPTWVSYRLPATAGGDLIPDETGEPIAIKSLEAFPSQPHASRAVDGNFHTRWSGGVQRAAADFTVELKQAQHVGQLVVCLGEFWTDFPQRLAIEISGDGVAWQSVFDGPTALHAYYGAVRHPKEVPLVFTLERDGVRFIRMKQLGWGMHDWSIAEVRVLR
jgi:hypothetical protein